MLSKKQFDRLQKVVRRHCREKGYQRSPLFNPMVPYDPVAVFMMAKHLTQGVTFNHYIAVAPEGHVYGYFFEHFGAEVRAVFVDYPPRQFQEVDDLSVIRGQDALILEDDVISGITLNLVVKGSKNIRPARYPFI